MSKTKPNDNAELSRRELISKYGVYTAPVVIAMLSPAQAYADMSGTPYSSIIACTNAHPPNMAGNPMTGHCEMFHPTP